MSCVAVNMYKEAYDVYIGRGSIWGNPFKMKNKTKAERDRVCDKYEKWFWTTDLPSHLPELIDKRLGCFCKPARCHGDFLAAEANKLSEERRRGHMGLKKPRGASIVNPIPDTFTVIDFETTDLSYEKGRIIEIGAARFTGGELVATFNTLVKQDLEVYPMSEQAAKLTGYTAQDVAKGMEEEAAIATLLSFAGDIGDPLVGHNILFDYEFLCKTAAHYGWDLSDDLIDTLTIARDRHPFPHKLGNMCLRYNIELEQAHSAQCDAIAAGRLLLAMHAEDSKYSEGQQVAYYINTIGYKRQYGEPLWVPDWITLKPQGSITIKEG